MPLVGSGWRAAFYARLARKMPDLFQLTGTWLHRPENTPEWQKKYGGAVAALPEDLLKDRPDFLVVALNKQHAFPYIMSLLEADVPLLLETPPAVEAQHMIALWEAAKTEKRRYLSRSSIRISRISAHGSGRLTLECLALCRT